MLCGAVVPRSVALIAVVLFCALPARAQSEADVMVEKFGREADRVEAGKKKDEPPRAVAQDAKAKKDAERKAAGARRAQEIRREAEAQRAAALARINAEKSGAPDAAPTAASPPAPSNEPDVTEDIRRLIQEAEAARLRAEETLAQNDLQKRETTAQPPSVADTAKSSREQADLARVRAEEELRRAHDRAMEGRRQIKQLARVRQIRQARFAAAQQEEVRRQRLAQEAAAERAKAAETARLAARQQAERQAQEEALRRRLAEEAAAAERAKAAEAARLVAQQQAEREAREDALRQRLAEEAAAAERAKAAETARLAAQQQAEREAREEALRRRLAEEADAMERAKAVEAARLIAQQQAERQAQEQAQRQRLAEQAAERARAEEVRLALEASRKHAELQAAAQAKEKALRLSEAQVPTADLATPTESSNEPAHRPAFPGRSGLGGEPDWRVTVLMTMKPGTYGIRRGANTADPVLCAIDGCYVSIGVDRPAVFMPRRRALGMGNTLGARAGACRQSLSCVFRDVALDYPGVLQPVDMHVLKHDRRQPQKILNDSDCSVAGGRLTCNRGIYTQDYVMWIVPERLAATAGPEVLIRALRDGLYPPRSAEVAPGVTR